MLAKLPELFELIKSVWPWIKENYGKLVIAIPLIISGTGYLTKEFLLPEIEENKKAINTLSEQIKTLSKYNNINKIKLDAYDKELKKLMILLAGKNAEVQDLINKNYVEKSEMEKAIEEVKKSAVIVTPLESKPAEKNGLLGIGILGL